MVHWYKLPNYYNTPTRHQLYGHLLPIMKTIQARQTRHAGHCWRSKDELISDVLLWTPHMVKQKQDDQLEHTYSSSVRIRDVALKTCQRRWTIGRSGERGSGISVLVSRHDDDDDITVTTMEIVYAETNIILGWVKSFAIFQVLSYFNYFSICLQGQAYRGVD